MKQYELQANERKITGRKVKKLRREGIIPATIYGHNIKSETIQLELNDFVTVYEQAGETGVINLRLNNGVRPVLIHIIDRHPVTRELLHVEFRQVNLKEKINANVPIELTGEAEAVTSKAGILIQELNEVEVEALPTDLPEKITVDVTRLKNVDDAISVADLKLPAEVTVLTEGDTSVVRISPLAVEEVEVKPEPTAVEGADAEGEAAPATETEPSAKNEDNKPEAKTGE